MVTEDPYLWCTDILRRFRITDGTLWRWKKEGKFPQPDLRIGKRQAWRASTIATFEASRQVVSVQ